MNMGESMDLVIVSGLAWDGLYLKSTVELAKQLARWHRVLFVEQAPSMAGSSPLLGSRLRQVDAHGRLHVLRPAPEIPHNRLPPGAVHDLVMSVNRARLRRGVTAAVQELGFDDILLINAWNPVYGLELLPPDSVGATMYYCYDEIGGAFWKARHGARAERQVLASADAVVATSPTLQDSKSELNSRCYLVPNGVDTPAFSRFREQGAQADSSVRSLPGPILGYLGCIDGRMDLTLVAEVAKQRPDWSIALVGPVLRGATTDAVKGLDNVHLFGSIPPDRIPAVLAAFDVGIVPFVLDPFTRALYPLKMLDYLAAGLRMVTTGFAQIPELEPWSATARSPNEFVVAVELELAAAGSDAVQRYAAADARSWEQRAVQLEQVLIRTLSFTRQQRTSA